MTLSKPVMDALFCLERNDVSWHTVNNELHRLSDAESRLEAKIEFERKRSDERGRMFDREQRKRIAGDALLLRYCVQVGELTKGLDPNDPIYFDIQRLGADYMTHLQGAGDE